MARLTRSPSVDLGIQHTASDANKGLRRSARQASIESVDSVSSQHSTRDTGTKKGSRGTKSVQDLSIVQEDSESESEDNESPEHEHDNDRLTDGPEINTMNASSGAQHQSPSGASQMSGTTAISHADSEKSIEELDFIMAEILPELLEGAHKIIDLLAPPNASEDDVRTVENELRVLGSMRAKRLRYAEEKLKITRAHYGEQEYIRVSQILRKLFGSPDPPGDSRPDAVLHAANIATAVKEFLVTPKESQNTADNLDLLDSHFPSEFLNRFHVDARLGNSALLEDTFTMALHIRTMYTIVVLEKKKERDDWEPRDVLASRFFEPPSNRNPRLSKYEDVFKNGQLKDILGPANPNTDKQEERIRDRLQLIQSTFRSSKDVFEDAELVDFDLLEDRFPWARFLTDLINWSRLRLTEIMNSVQQQGGIEKMTESLIETITNNNSQAEIAYQQPPAVLKEPNLMPPPPLAANTPRLYKSNKAAIRVMERLKRDSSARVSSSSPQPTSANVSKTLKNSSSQGRVDREPAESDEDLENPDSGQAYAVRRPGRSTDEYLHHWEKADREKNKENLKTQATVHPKKRLLDRQEGAYKDQWRDNSQDSVTIPASRKRSYNDLSEEDEDEGFQGDQRVPDPSRRAAARPSHNWKSSQRQGPSPKFVRIPEDRARIREIEQRQAEAQLQANASVESIDGIVDSTPIFTQVSAAAKVIALRQSLISRPSQSRMRWSQEDETYFVELVEQYGCCWSFLSKQDGWIDGRNTDPGSTKFEVSLKDKARNMKVAFIKADIPLPVNFEKIRLGRKEIESIRKVVHDYVQLDC